MLKSKRPKNIGMAEELFSCMVLGTRSAKCADSSWHVQRYHLFVAPVRVQTSTTQGGLGG
jgi:hypothetical protein